MSMHPGQSILFEEVSSSIHLAMKRHSSVFGLKDSDITKFAHPSF